MFWHHPQQSLVSTLTFAGVGKTVIASFDYKRFKQRYTREVFRMFDNEEPQKVTLICANEVMKGVLDKFGMDITVKKSDPEHF